MNIKKYFAVAVFTFLITGCAILEKPVTKRYAETDKYQFVAIPTTGSLSSSSSSQIKELNPGSVIEGLLLKKGFTSVNNITPEIVDKTLIVKYGESGKRDVVGGLGGYTLEVTIKIISAKTLDPLYLCTAEGQGSTEADDIREAITRCLSDF